MIRFALNYLRQLSGPIGIKLAEIFSFLAIYIDPPVSLPCIIDRLMHGQLTATDQSDSLMFDKYEWTLYNKFYFISFIISSVILVIFILDFITSTQTCTWIQ